LVRFEINREKTTQEQWCEAYFYAGAVRLMEGDRETARDHFQMCLDTGVKNLTEHNSASAELKRIEKGK
jgi:lipoprotein NlpI